MMGERRVMQEALFYGFSLERHVPDDHRAEDDLPNRSGRPLHRFGQLRRRLSLI